MALPAVAPVGRRTPRRSERAEPERLGPACERRPRTNRTLTPPTNGLVPIVAKEPSIGIDDGLWLRHRSGMEGCDEFAVLFRAIYLTFHRRDAPRSELTGASRAVLQHLAMTGPLTVDEAAQHLGRAQSVVSEIVTHLTRHGLLEREPDPHDLRRTLVWLTDHGFQRLQADGEVLSKELLAKAIGRLTPEQQTGSLDGMRALLLTPAEESTP
jgi:DNA-binding MarR family transcriptional regulator